MSLRTALRSLFSAARRGRHRRLMPRMEHLEDRSMPSYVLTDLGTLGGAESAAYALNAAGQVVGDADSTPWTGSLEGRHAFLWSRGQLQDLGTLDQRHSAARAVNKHGQVAGWTYDDDQWPHAFVWDAAGGMRDLGIAGRAYGINADGLVVGEWHGGGAFLKQKDDVFRVPTLPGYESNTAYAVNNLGQVVGAVRGRWDVAANEYRTARAFLWHRTGKVEDLGTLPAAEHSEALAVNDAGQVVGRAGVLACGPKYCGWIGSRGFLWQRDVGMIDLGGLGLGPSVHVVAHGINARGDVVGAADGRAFLYTGGVNGTMKDLASQVINLDGWYLKAATAINERGQIVGYGEIDGETRAFLLKPRPFVIDPPIPCPLPPVLPVPSVVARTLPLCPDPIPVPPCPVHLLPYDSVLTPHPICRPRPVPVAADPQPLPPPVCLVSFDAADLAADVWRLWCAKRAEPSPDAAP